MKEHYIYSRHEHEVCRFCQNNTCDHDCEESKLEKAVTEVEQQWSVPSKYSEVW